MIIFTILHLFGVVVGFGAAISSDFLALIAYRDGKLNRSEIKLLSAGSKLVWFGLGIILSSGLLIFLSKPLVYLYSTKFLAKMLIVVAIAINGLFLHLVLLGPIVKRLKTVSSVGLTNQQKRWLPVLVSISFCSWFFALILGSLRSLPYGVSEILTVYFAVIVLCVVGSKILLTTKLLGRHF